jgi:hypothetical protein
MNGEPQTIRNGLNASDNWDARGWPRVPGAVRPGSRIGVPADRSTIVARAIAAGVAWAPRLGLRGVEVAIDGGRRRPARLSPSIARRSGGFWR